MKRIFLILIPLSLMLSMPQKALSVASATDLATDSATHERNISLNEAIALARVQSVDAAVALNELKTAYWEYRTFRADLLPEVNFTFKRAV